MSGNIMMGKMQENWEENLGTLNGESGSFQRKRIRKENYIMEKDELRDKLMKLDSTYMRLWGQAPVARNLYETINDNEQVEV